MIVFVFIMKELSIVNGHMESCPCSCCWLCSYTKAVRTSINVSPYSMSSSLSIFLTAPFASLIKWLLTFNRSTCLELGEICRQIGLPPGALNILTGLGPEAGAPLASHPHVDKVCLFYFRVMPFVYWSNITF